MMTGQAVVFLRPDGAGGLGHVGWGFADPHGPGWFIGAMENPLGWPAVPPGWGGFWYVQVANGKAAADAMLNPPAFGAPSGTPAYAKAKKVDVLSPNVQAVQQKMIEWAQRPYVAAGGNCMNCVFDILVAYGAALPDPTVNPAEWFPNNWFQDINSPILPASVLDL
jgi:hypothetical protein